MASRRLEVLGALVLAVSLCAYVAASRAAGHRAMPYLAVHFALAGLMFLGWRTARTARDVTVAVVVGVIARFALVGVSSFTTTDTARYLWDGAVALSGHDPYALVPRAAELASLHFPLPADHLDVATCYPPLALALFTMASITGANLAWFTWKLMVAAASSLTVWVVWRHLRETDRARDVVLAAWSPVLVLESGVGAHFDAFTALAIVGAVVMVDRKRIVSAALLAGAAGAIKLLPFVVVLALAGRVKRPFWFMALAAAPLALSLGVAELLGMTAPGSLPYVAENWSFAAPLWTWLYSQHPREDGAVRAGLAVFSLVAILLVSLRSGAARNVRDTLLIQLATSPVMYPWYGVPLAAANALAPSRWAFAVLLVMPCSYEVLDAYQSTGVWVPAWWPIELNAIAIVVGLSADLLAGVWRFSRQRAQGG